MSLKSVVNDCFYLVVALLVMALVFPKVIAELEPNKLIIKRSFASKVTDFSIRIMPYIGLFILILIIKEVLGK